MCQQVCCSEHAEWTIIVSLFTKSIYSLKKHLIRLFSSYSLRIALHPKQQQALSPLVTLYYPKKRKKIIKNGTKICYKKFKKFICIKSLKSSFVQASAAQQQFIHIISKRLIKLTKLPKKAKKIFGPKLGSTQPPQRNTMLYIHIPSTNLPFEVTPQAATSFRPPKIRKRTKMFTIVRILRVKL